MNYPYVATDGREKIEGAIGQNGLAVRGGSWNSDAADTRSFHREKVNDDNANDTIGFRCASSTSDPVPTQISQPTAQPTDMASTWTSPVDGMLMVYVPKGDFIMGNNYANEYDGPEHIVFLEPFWIDQTEVTNAMYIQCVQAAVCKPPQDVRSSQQSNYYGNPDFGNFPVINVTFWDAKTYCAWAGRDLPGEAEWEKAARGPDGLTYPWGEGIDSSLANYYFNIGDTVAVGSYPNAKSPYGAFDMAGNVAEWLNNVLVRYPFNASDGREDTSGGIGIAIRGGAWNSEAVNVRSFMREKADASHFDNTLGFRCSRSSGQ
jgi:serine/threonine-protein kinase